MTTDNLRIRGMAKPLECEMCKEFESDNVDGFRVARTRDTTRRTQRFERRGLNMGDLGSQ
jgi:hypothetical protein